MELEKQVCSLELAEKLEELGVPQESYFYWNKHWKNPDKKESGFWELEHGTNPSLLNKHADAAFGERVAFAAFTVAELGEMLPGGIVSFKCNQYHFLNKEGKKWWCDFTPGGRPSDMTDLYEGNCFADTEADARAKMLIYLLKNHLITITKKQTRSAQRPKRKTEIVRGYNAIADVPPSPHPNEY